MEVIPQIWRFLQTNAEQHNSPIALRGGRRAGKTWTTCQYLLNQMWDNGDTILFASMTADQGSAGAYKDCKDIIATNDAWYPYFEVLKSPRQITTRFSRDGRVGTAMFRSFKDPETAKGGAVDWAFINEANKFTYQQYLDIAANARKGVILDYNPNIHFWADDVVKIELHVKWQWNRNHLTAAQLQWFDDIYGRAHRDNATGADLYYYKVYYQGEYADLQGDIFTPDNIQVCKQSELPSKFDQIIVFSDPSARVGGDYHASVMAALSRDRNRIYILDTDSRNIGDDYEMAVLLQGWSRRYDRIATYIETNGLGEAFYRYCRDYNFGIKPYCSNAKKTERIMSNYHTIVKYVVFVETDHLQDYLDQVYTFDGYEGKCEHDDNIDALNSAVTLLKNGLQFTRQ